MQIDETMTELPLDRLDADRFYRTLQAFSIAASNGASDPWAQIPWRIADRHKEIVMKLLSNDPDHRKEVEAYLLECLRLTAGQAVAQAREDRQLRRFVGVIRLQVGDVSHASR